MGCLKTPLPFLFVFLVSLFSLSKTHHFHPLGNQPVIPLANQTEVHEVMTNYGFPKGLIPENVKSYTLHESGSFVITLNSTCYVQFDRLVFFGTDIRGKMSYGAVHELSGIQAKKYIFWFSVTAIEVSQTDGTIEFFVGPFSESYPAAHFTDIQACGSDSSLRNPSLYLDDA